MNLKTLTNETLNQNLKSLVKSERVLLSEILQLIAEVDSRKLYLKLAYPSLFEYLTKELGYSFGSAQRRIDAARLMQDVPDLNEKLESGLLNLAQVSVLQKSLREKTKQTGVKISSVEKQGLVNAMQGKSLDQTQSLIAQSLEIQIKTAAKTHVQSDESVRLEITLSKEQWEKLKTARELLSNSLPHGSWDQMLEYISDQVIKQKTKTKTKPKSKTKTEQETKPVQKPKPAQKTKPAAKQQMEKQAGNSHAPAPIPERISSPIRRAIFVRDRDCQHQDPRSNRKCGSKWNLHVDHIQPVWAGGTSVLANLRLLCAAHNLNRYREQSGIR